MQDIFFYIFAALTLLFGFLVAVVALFVSGGFVFAMGPLTGPPGGALTAFLSWVESRPSPRSRRRTEL